MKVLTDKRYTSNIYMRNLVYPNTKKLIIQFQNEKAVKLINFLKYSMA